MLDSPIGNYVLYNRRGANLTEYLVAAYGGNSTVGSINFFGDDTLSPQLRSEYTVSGVGGAGYSAGFEDSYGFEFTSIQSDVAAAVPEPTTWAMMLGGFGLIGATMRRRRAVQAYA